VLQDLVGDDQIERAVGEGHGLVFSEMLDHALVHERREFPRVVAAALVEHLGPVAVHAPPAQLCDELSMSTAIVEHPPRTGREDIVDEVAAVDIHRTRRMSVEGPRRPSCRG
jgi:hypothetical protein